jgi:hypothetical protein
MAPILSGAEDGAGKDGSTRQLVAFVRGHTE